MKMPSHGVGYALLKEDLIFSLNRNEYSIPDAGESRILKACISHRPDHWGKGVKG